MHRLSHSILQSSLTGWLVPALIGAVLLYIHVDTGLLQYDEADYVAAAQQGFFANYLETNTLSMRAFIVNGLRDAFLGEHESVSKAIRASKDVSFYRHYHPPLTVYLFTLAAFLFGSHEMVFRFTISGITVLIIPVVYWSLRLLLSEKGHWVGLLSAWFVAVSPMIFTTAQFISHHPLFCLIAILTLTVLVRYFQTQRLQDFYLFVCILTLAFLTNEFAIFLLAGCLVCALLIPNSILNVTRERLIISHHFFGGILCTLCLIFLFWPGGILKLSIVKSYVFMAYFVLVKGALSYGHQSLFDIWGARFAISPIESMLLILGLVCGMIGFIRQQIDRKLLPLLCFPVVIFLANILNSSDANTYVISIYPLLFIFAAMSIVYWIRPLSHSVQFMTLLSVITGVSFFNIYLKRFPPPADFTSLEKAIQTLKMEGNSGDHVLVNYGNLPTVSYYLPDMNVSTIYLETQPEDLIQRFAQKMDRFFLFFGPYEDLHSAVYKPMLELHYQELQRISNQRENILVLFQAK